MVHMGEERCRDIVDYTAEGGTGKLGYWSARIVEVKTISTTNGEPVLQVNDKGG
jgi:hypothetical protein